MIESEIKPKVVSEDNAKMVGPGHVCAVSTYGTDLVLV